MVFDRTGMWGTSYTNVPFLTGYYNNNFNPGMGANEAARFSSTGMIVAYITPFFTALLADGLFGDFSTIFILMACFSLPGLILTLISAYPGLLSQTFGMQNQEIMRVGMLIFYPIGNGGMNVSSFSKGIDRLYRFAQTTHNTFFFIRHLMIFSPPNSTILFCKKTLSRSILCGQALHPPLLRWSHSYSFPPWLPSIT